MNGLIFCLVFIKTLICVVISHITGSFFPSKLAVLHNFASYFFFQGCVVMEEKPCLKLESNADKLVSALCH